MEGSVLGGAAFVLKFGSSIDDCWAGEAPAPRFTGDVLKLLEDIMSKNRDRGKTSKASRGARVRCQDIAV